MSRRILCLCLWLLIMHTSLAQVNYQTGSATFSLPMFEWKDHVSRLNGTVALNYNSGNGLKVNDVASNVGQGWNLIAGGVITRLQVGEPDDQRAYNGTGSESDLRKYPNGHLYAGRPATDGCPSALTRYPIYGHMNQIYTQHNEVVEDKQKDYFSFQFNGKSGMFVLDPNGDKGVTLGDSRLKITFARNESMANNTYNGTRTTITSFTIQDTDGLLYKFTRHGKTRVLQTNYTDVNLSYPMKQPKLEGGKVYYQAGFENTSFVNTWIIGSWYLTEVEDVLTHRKIYFNYVDRSVNNVAGQDIIYNQSGNYSTIFYKRSITTTPEITSIVYPDGHNVAFTYGAIRHDLAGEYALASVDMTYMGRTISRYLLNTTYMVFNRYGNPLTQLQRKAARLCLRSVRKIGVDLKEDSPPYLFDYYLGSNAADDMVPMPFAHTKDIWGFYNGTNSVGYNNEAVAPTSHPSSLTNNQLRGLCFRKNGVSGVVLNAKQGYAKNGLLRQVIYPTGGTLTYEYDQNVGVLNGSSMNVGGVHVSKTLTTDGGHSNGCNNPITINYDYVMNGPGSSSSLWGLEMPVNQVVSQVHYHAEHKKYKWSLSGCGIFGCCYFKYVYPGILSQTQAVSLTDFQRFMQAISPVLGIISIVTTVVDVINLVCYSSGVMAWVAVVVDIVAGLVTLAVTCFSGNNSSDKTDTIVYNLDLNGASPLPAQFKRVEIVEGSGGNGKTVQEFTSEDDYAVWVPSNPTFSAKQRFAPWAYGLPKSTKVYNALGNLVSQTVNTYSWTWNVGTCHPGMGGCYPMAKQPLDLKSCKCMVKKSSSQRNTDWSNPAHYNANYITSSNNDLAVDIYDLYTGRVHLLSTSEKVYNTNDVAKYVETVTEYGYNSWNLQVSHIAISNSDGKYLGKSFYYPDTWVEAWAGTSNVEMNTLYNNNILNEVVTVSEKVYGSYTHEKVNIFKTLPNGNIRLWKVMEHRFTQPDVNGHSWSFDDPTYWGNYKTIQVNTYDNSGNLVCVQDEGNRKITNIYDYFDKYIGASVINADTTDRSAYCSFESVTFGNWQLTGAGPAYVNNSGVTGTRAFNLASNTFQRSLNTSKPYTLSFWANGVASVSGGTLVTSAPTLNGFTYYEYAVPQGTANVSITGNVLIDELRIYPKSARMRSTTYDPLIGKTSECDENNRITYYDYDNLGRLRFVKDEGKNIVKMYEYSSVSKQSGCPGIYYNRLTTESIQKNNCGAGYIGGEVTYTVPANKYSSTVSQEEADAQVDYELATLGQDYANANGTCIPIYYNTVQSLVVTSQGCPPGYKGGNVTYTVPAGRYQTTVSQAAANQMALDDIAANAQSWANEPANRSCVVDTDPDWEWDNTTYYCYNPNGQLPPHMMIQERDVNPNSSTYNSTRWSDAGPSSECPAGNYYNTQQSQVFTRNDCSGGSQVTYTVPPGTYSSTISLADANQQAINDINANGQAYANANGTCCTGWFTWASGVSGYYSYVQPTGTEVSFTLVTPYPTGQTNWTIGTVPSCMAPTAQRVVPYRTGTTEFQVIFYPSGTVNILYVSGPMPTSGAVIGFSGKYDRFSTMYYSAAASGNFWRNNCPAGQIGGMVTFSVAPYQYTSIISQADANQQAQNYINANGQNYANTNGTCTVSCTFTPQSGMSFYSSSISNNGSTSSFNFVFPSPSSSWWGGTLGTISTGCRPSGTRYVTVTDGANSSRTWNVTINTNGVVSVSVNSGPAHTNSGPPAVISGSYSN